VVLGGVVGGGFWSGVLGLRGGLFGVGWVGFWGFGVGSLVWGVEGESIFF